MTAAEKKWIKQKIAKWQKRLLLSDYSFDITFHDTPAESDDGLDTYAHVWVQQPTLTTPIDIYPAILELGASEREQILLHELVHVWLRGGEEDVVAHITTTLWRLCEGNKSKTK